MRYDYQYTKEDVWNYIMVWRYRKWKPKGALLTRIMRDIALVYLVELLIPTKGIAVKCAVALVTLLSFWAASVHKDYSQVRRRILGVKVVLRLEEGILKMGGTFAKEHPLEGTPPTICYKKLILIPVAQKPAPVFVLVPCRIFADDDEKTRFLQELDRQREYANGQARVGAQESAQEPQETKETGPQETTEKETAQETRKKRINWQILIIGVLLVGLVLVAVWTREQDKGTGIGMGGYLGQTSVSLKDQVRTLQNLGLSVSEEQPRHLEDLVKENPQFREYVEDNPYLVLLSDMGFPQYDEEHHLVSYPDELYWFDLEAFDLEESYTQFLGAVEHLSGGEVEIAVEGFKEDDVDWDRGTGTLVLVFSCNGRPYRMDLKVDNDWMDMSVLAQMNYVLEQENTLAKLYGCGDGGQGCLIFYRDEEWAKRFVNSTGIRLTTTRSDTL